VSERRAVAEGVGRDDTERPIALQYDSGDVGDVPSPAGADRLPHLVRGDSLPPERIIQETTCRSSSVGRAVTIARPAGRARDDQATRNCNPARSARATAPSAQLTSVLRRMVARVDPSATVTTRSKALSLASVRLPDTRRTATTVT
jgi:hypothetical protein